MAGHNRFVIPDHMDAAGPRLPVVTPCELPDGVRLVYADDHGVRRAVDVEDAGLIDFGRTRPFRKPAAYRGQRNFPGWWWSATTRSHVVYESWLERHHIIEADRDARIAGIAGQPFALTWSLKKRSVRHIPDLFCQTFDGGGIVTDCRPVKRMDWATNLRWLAGYRHPRFADAGIEQLLIATLAQPGPLADAAGRAGDPIRVMPVVFHLLWLGRLTADLSRPLGNSTIVAVSADPLEAT